MCVCKLTRNGALSVTTVLHKHGSKTIWITAESSLTFLSVSTMYQVTCLCHIILCDGTILQMSKQAYITQTMLRRELGYIRLTAFLSISSPSLYSGCFLWMPLLLPPKTAHPLKPANILFLSETFLRALISVWSWSPLILAQPTLTGQLLTSLPAACSIASRWKFETGQPRTTSNTEIVRQYISRLSF